MANEINAKVMHPVHLQRCLCWDTLEGGWRCYVYDDISKYWCTQSTTEHDPDGDNHVSDYADYRITHWMDTPPKPTVWKSLAKEFPPSGKRILLYDPRYHMSYCAVTESRADMIFIKYQQGLICNIDDLKEQYKDFAWTNPNF